MEQPQRDCQNMSNEYNPLRGSWLNACHPGLAAFLAANPGLCYPALTGQKPSKELHLVILQ